MNGSILAQNRIKAQGKKHTIVAEYSNLPEAGLDKHPATGFTKTQGLQPPKEGLRVLRKKESKRYAG
jgi:hypothetical protein